MRFAALAIAVFLFLSIFGCAGQQPQSAGQTGQNQSPAQPQANGAQNVSAVQGANANGSGAGAGEGAGAVFKEWKAPDGSITLQVPEGWKANEKQADRCSVNWAVRNPAGTSSAFMTNQIMVLKSESARQIYKTYGLTGIDSVPVAGYANAEQALSGVVARLSGAANVKVLGRDAALSSQFSQAACISGLAACDAQVFEAASSYNGTLMRGYYLVQTYDFGEGATWWINLWGYETPAADWEKSVGIVEKIFTSLSVTDEWAAKCGKSQAGAEIAINEVIKSRQAASEKSAAEWDKYIRGE